MAQKVTVETIVAAPVEKVWECFTGPEHIKDWNNASNDWHTTKAENDLRTGGAFFARMEAKDGSQGFDFAGTYNDVVSHERIAYTMGDGRTVVVVFTPEEGKTRVTETFEIESQNSEEVQRDGWQAILNNFRDHTEAH
jgi:uncharacterized protein YndB with AHSA1/START domain